MKTETAEERRIREKKLIDEARKEFLSHPENVEVLKELAKR